MPAVRDVGARFIAPDCFASDMSRRFRLLSAGHGRLHLLFSVSSGRLSRETQAPGDTMDKEASHGLPARRKTRRHDKMTKQTQLQYKLNNANYLYLVSEAKKRSSSAASPPHIRMLVRGASSPGLLTAFLTGSRY